MNDDPNELAEPRELLGKFQGNPRAIEYLKRGLGILREIIEGDFSENCKAKAGNLVATYQLWVLDRIRPMVTDPLSFELHSLRHWHEVTAIFWDAGFRDSQEFNNARDALDKKYFEGCSPFILRIFPR